MRFSLLTILTLCLFHHCFCTTIITAREPDEIIDLWPQFAPGETTRVTGVPLPRRENENPPATRIGQITQPRVMVYHAPQEKRNGTAVLIFPGGGYNYVVADKEGSEAAQWLNSLGITAAVVHYRTKLDKPGTQPLWVRPTQDGQRAISLFRERAQEWGLNPEQIGVLGFSAGGQAAAFVTCRFEKRAYEPTDAIDNQSCRPDFAMLLYPWKLLSEDGKTLRDELVVTGKTPPTFFAHTDDDRVTSLSSILLYSTMKQNGVPAELHIYQTGGHGYGMRPVENSNIDTWPARAESWLRIRGLIEH